MYVNCFLIFARRELIYDRTQQEKLGIPNAYLKLLYTIGTKFNMFILARTNSYEFKNMN